MKKIHGILDHIYSFLITFLILLILYLIIGREALIGVMKEHLISYNYIDNIYFLEDEISENQIRAVSDTLKSSGKVYETFLEDSCYIVFTKDLDNERFSIDKTKENVVGTYIEINDYKKISILIGLHNYDNVALHELGHYLDYKTNHQSEKEEFALLFEEYKSINFNDYGKIENYDYISGDIKEFFAERYSDFVLNPSLLKTLEPNLYDYFERLIEEKL